jgi:hypothetical protein
MMLQLKRDQSYGEYEVRSFAETPFLDPRANESEEEPLREGPAAEAFAADYEVSSPFVSGEWSETGETEAGTPEVAALGETAAELKDSEFREALEQLADEALEMHADQLAGEYGDRETRDLAAERLLLEHFEPLAAQAEATLDRFQETLETYETGALTEMEIERIAAEVLPTNQPLSPASEQFLGGLLRKAGNLIKKAAQAPLKLAGKGLAFVGKLALGPLFGPLKKLARFLLGHVVRFALNKLPATLQPLARKLSERLFHEMADAHESEAEQYEQTEAEGVPAAPDIARLEAEFDLHAAQLLLTPDEAEADHLVSAYGDEVDRGYESPLAALDRARAELADGLSRLRPGESAQPAMEQFLPAVAALWPAIKAGIAVVGRPKVINFIGGLLAKLVAPILGAEPAKLLAPALADVGFRAVGFETAPSNPQAIATEALAATVEEAAARLGELPPHVFENETLLDSAVREAFEDAASTYFPASLIKPELRETADRHGAWKRMPSDGREKRYAKYSEKLPVTITPRVAAGVHTFGGATLKDHLRDRMDIHPDRTVKTNVRLYQALPGTRASTIARAEGIRPHDLHPLTPHAAAALLGPAAAGLGRPTPPQFLHSPNQLHLRQRLYHIEPPHGRQYVHHRRHARLARTELLISLPKGEIQMWLFLSERLCQEISAELTKTHNAAAAFRLIKPLVHRAAHRLKAAILERHLPPDLRIISEAPNLDHRVPAWLRQVAHHLAAKVDEWASHQIVQYLQHNANEFRRISADHHDGLTLHIVMSRIPGFDVLQLAARGKPPKALEGTAWLNGTPVFVVHAHAGHKMHAHAHAGHRMHAHAEEKMHAHPEDKMHAHAGRKIK